MSTNTVRDAMTVSPTTVEAHESAVEAARLMAAQDVGSLPVLEGRSSSGSSPIATSFSTSSRRTPILTR